MALDIGQIPDDLEKRTSYLLDDKVDRPSLVGWRFDATF